MWLWPESTSFSTTAGLTSEGPLYVHSDYIGQGRERFTKRWNITLSELTLPRLLHLLSLFKDPGPLAVEREDFKRVQAYLQLWVPCDTIPCDAHFENAMRIVWWKSMIPSDTIQYHPIPSGSQWQRSVAWPQWTWESSFLHGLAGPITITWACGISGGITWYRVNSVALEIASMPNIPIEQWLRLE